MEQRKSAEISALPFAEAGKAISEKYRTARLELDRTSSALSPTHTSSSLPVARRWKEVSAEEKAAYDDMAKVDKMRFQREQKQFDAEHGVPEARSKPKPKPKKSKPKPTEESGEDDEPATTSDEPHQATKPRVLPMPLLELGTLVPRTKHPMRTESIEVGDKLVWVTPPTLIPPRTPSHPLAPPRTPLHPRMPPCTPSYPLANNALTLTLTLSRSRRPSTSSTRTTLRHSTSSR